MFNRKLKKQNAELNKRFNELEQHFNELDERFIGLTQAFMEVAPKMDDILRVPTRIVPIEVLEGGYIPEYKTPFSAGADLCAVIEEDKKYSVIYPNQRMKIRTGIKIQLPDNAEAQIRPRSGLSLTRGLVAILGTIDSDYRGEICIILHNITDKKVIINRGDRLAQIVFNGAGGLFQARFQRVEKIKNNTQRGENGFGSTGINDDEKER